MSNVLCARQDVLILCFMRLAVLADFLSCGDEMEALRSSPELPLTTTAVCYPCTRAPN